jgi:hypothetical protein
MSGGGLSNRLAWYARRLSAMSTAEVVHRVGELAKKRSARLVQPGWARFDQGDGPLPLFPAAIDVTSADADLLARWERVAEAAMARRHRFLGVEWPAAGNASLWHFDPVSQREWPKDRYCFDINYRHSDVYGDVKYVWEINRLQYLQPIAALAARTGRADLRTFVTAEIASWIADNPPFHGINWPSGIELSVRAISVLIATRLLGAEAFSPAETRAIRAFLAATGDWLSRYPSRFSSANNHLIAEAVGLYVIAMACPELAAAARWRVYARRVLAEEVDRQFHADGIGAEQSPTYTAFTLELYVTAVRAAQAVGDPLPQAVLDKLATVGEALSWFMDENGAVPRIGDDDEGRVIVSDPEADRFYVASVLSATAAVCGRPDIAPPVAPPHLRDLVFGRRLAPTKGEGVHTFAEGGYTVLRDRVHDRQLVLAMDHGPLGFLSIAAHGHADTLAVWLTYGGRALLADAGTYLYHAGGTWRDAFRGTPLHNTLSITGESSSLVSGAFNWKAKAEASRLAVDGRLETFSCEAAHDGYKARFGVEHVRALRRVSTDTFSIEDRLEGAAAPVGDVAITFLSGEGIEIRATDRTGIFDFVAEGTALLRLTGPEGWAGSVVSGLEAERLGWRSPCFGVKTPSDQLVFRGSAAPGTTMRTDLRLL